MAVAGFATYGIPVDPNILQSLPRGILRILAEGFMTAHMVTVILFFINVAAHHLEKVLQLPTGRCYVTI